MSRSRNRRRRQQWQAEQKSYRKEQKKQPTTHTITPSKPVGAVSVYSGTSAYSSMNTRKRWCDHYQAAFPLEDGLSIFVSAWADKPFGKELQYITPIIPDIGFYLDNYWQSDRVLVSAGSTLPVNNDEPGEFILWPWPDRGIPRGGMRQFQAALRWLLHQLSAGKIVETGCFAAHGRTGTLLACLLVTQGLDANEAINRVRKDHCDQAVESLEQVQFVRRFDTHVNGRVHLPGLNDAQPSDWTSRLSAATTGDTSPPRLKGSEDESTGKRLGSARDEKFCVTCPHQNHWGRECDVCGCLFSSKANIPGEDSSRTGWDPMPTSESVMTDDESDYELWLRLNANGYSDDIALMELARQTNMDEYEMAYRTQDAFSFNAESDCAYPPCSDPWVCNVDQGECYKACMWNNPGDVESWETAR